MRTKTVRSAALAVVVLALAALPASYPGVCLAEDRSQSSSDEIAGATPSQGQSFSSSSDGIDGATDQSQAILSDRTSGAATPYQSQASSSDGIEGVTPPNIDITSAFDFFFLAPGESSPLVLGIGNSGGSDLEFQISTTTAWCRVSVTGGRLGPGQVSLIPGIVDAAALAVGDYDDSIVIASNDPDDPIVSVGVRLLVRNHAILDVDPGTLNLDRRGQWITAYIELSDGRDPSQIDISSVRLNLVVSADTRHSTIGDHDHNHIPDLALKFPLDLLRPTLGEGPTADVTVSGYVEISGRFEPFIGSEPIRVIRPSTP